MAVQAVTRALHCLAETLVFVAFCATIVYGLPLAYVAITGRAP